MVNQDDPAACQRRARRREFRAHIDDRSWRRQAAHALQCCGLSPIVLMLFGIPLELPDYNKVSFLSVGEAEPVDKLGWSWLAASLGLGLLVHGLIWYAPRSPTARKRKARNDDTPRDPT